MTRVRRMREIDFALARLALRLQINPGMSTLSRFWLLGMAIDRANVRRRVRRVLKARGLL